MNNGVYIYSNPTGTGKTSLLSDWVSRNDEIVGILSPKIEGQRYLQDVSTGDIKILDDPEGTISVGRHRFDAEAFVWAEQQITSQLLRAHQWLILDEIGPLELQQQKGFYNLLSELLQDKQLKDTRFLVVVRDTEVERFMQVFEQPNAKVLGTTFFEGQDIPNLQGLVLAGGQSTRMQRDKATLDYNGTEQWRYLDQLLRPFTSTQWISINEAQENSWAKNENANFIADAKLYKDHGPLSGLLSAHELLPTEGFMIIGVDYPNLNTSDFIQINNARDEKYEAVCFEFDNFIQPLFCVIENKGMQNLETFYAEGGRSIKQFLQTLNCNVIQSKNDKLFENINTPEDLDAYRKNS